MYKETNQPEFACISDNSNMVLKWFVALLGIHIFWTKEVISEEFNATLSDLKSRIEVLESKMKKIDKDDSSGTESHVLLYVKVSTSMRDVSNHVTVIFDTPLFNYENYYNENDGVFVSPFSGKLLVSWTIVTDEFAKTKLMVEDRSIASLITAASSVTRNDQYGQYSSSSTRESSSSTMAVVNVEKGDHVFLRTASNDNHILGDVSTMLVRALY